MTSPDELERQRDAAETARKPLPPDLHAMVDHVLGELHAVIDHGGCEWATSEAYWLTRMSAFVTEIVPDGTSVEEMKRVLVAAAYLARRVVDAENGEARERGVDTVH